MKRPRLDSRQIEASAVTLVTALVLSGPTRGFGAEEKVAPADAPNEAVRWTPERAGSRRYFVHVAVQDDAALHALRTTEAIRWTELLSVHAGQGRLLEEIGLPPMAGDYSVRDNGIRFTPQFPLEPGLNYRAVFRPDHLPGCTNAPLQWVTSEFRSPEHNRTPTTTVSAVYPSAEVLPENLLKFYLHFSAPMSGGGIYRHIHLLNDNELEVELPFLELDEELWNREMTRLTLFIDPGRIKREVRPLEEIGPALEEGKRFTLLIDRNWPDANGAPMQSNCAKHFSVGPPDRVPPDPHQWEVTSPTLSTRAPLIVDFGEPMDQALALRMVHVIEPDGKPIRGISSLTDHERRWSFEPDKPWQKGTHQFMVEPTIEDLAGNNIGKPFEVDLAAGAQRRSIGQPVQIAFEVK